ncbi:MAG: heme-binding protein [Gammaproteobacteria bacterium]|nr:heme-binding protein [Gammaproteobacteria bacterium]
MATEAAFPKTPVDEIQLRELPAGCWLSTSMEGKYFDESGNLFRRLFDYINERDISMTVPVEGGIDRAEMRFYAGDRVEPLEHSDTVRVVEVPARRVVSIGGKGAYSEENVNAALARLEEWLIQHELAAADAPYAVYWNGPFTPWFLKRFEVHIPVEAAGSL